MRATLTVDPQGPFPMTLPAEDFDTVCNALGLNALGREVGRATLERDGAWTLTVGTDAYRMDED